MNLVFWREREMKKNDLETCITIIEGIISSLELVVKIFREKGTMLEKENK